MEEESEDEDEEDEEDEGEEAMDEEEEEEPTVVESEAAAGLATPSGIQTVMAGLETPAHIELRKPTAPPPNSEKPMGPPPQLYHVLPERKTSTSGQGLMGSDHLYDVRAARESDST